MGRIDYIWIKGVTAECVTSGVQDKMVTNLDEDGNRKKPGQAIIF